MLALAGRGLRVFGLLSAAAALGGVRIDAFPVSYTHLIIFHRMRVISSPSISTRGVVILIFSIAGFPFLSLDRFSSRAALPDLSLIHI